MFELAIDRSMWDHPGKTTTMKYAIRKYKNRGAIAVGTEIRIVKFEAQSDQYGIHSRVLVETLDGSVKRWVPATSVTPIEGGNEKAFARMGEIARNILNDRN